MNKFNNNNDGVTTEIERAHALAEAGDIEVAVLSFALVREMVVRFTDQDALNRKIKIQYDSLSREREKFRALVAKANGGQRPFVILGDSLGLPRPHDVKGSMQGVDETYPWLIAQASQEHRVDSICQRYFTTQSAVDILTSDPNLGVNGDVVIHLGLNDCANRIFQENERLALQLFPESARERIVEFAQKYRREILRQLPSRHYVSLSEFRCNLARIAGILLERNARRVIFTSIILPPLRFWGATPGVNKNFASYNLALMETASEFGFLFFDLDRYVWQSQHEKVLLEDGMHLSGNGHNLFASQVLNELGLR